MVPGPARVRQSGAMGATVNRIDRIDHRRALAMSPKPPMTGLAREAQRALGVPALLPKPHHWSQIHGLDANVVIPGLEGTSRDDVHSDAQEVLQVLEQAEVIKEGCAWLEIHEQI